MTILVTMVCSDLRGDLASLQAIASKSRALTLTRLSDGGYWCHKVPSANYGGAVGLRGPCTLVIACKHRVTPNAMAPLLFGSSPISVYGLP